MQTQIKVRGYHLDVYQHVNNARYLEFLEEARWDGLESSPAFHWMTARNIAFVVVNININYRRPAVLGDVLTVTSKLEQLNGKSGTLSQVVTLNPNGEVTGYWSPVFCFITVITPTLSPRYWLSPLARRLQAAHCPQPSPLMPL